MVGHRGRRSGRPYRTPVVAFLRGNELVIPLGYGRNVDWAQNLLAADGGTITRMGRELAVSSPRIIDAEEARKMLPWPVWSVFLGANLPGYLRLQVVGPQATSAGASSGGIRRTTKDPTQADSWEARTTQ